MKWILSLGLGLFIVGCGGTGTTPDGNAEMASTAVVEQPLSTSSVSEGSTNPAEQKRVITLFDDDNNSKNGENGTEIARIVFSSATKIRDAEGNDKCECKPADPCVPCAVSIERSCGSAINTTERLAEAQPTDDTKVALLGATYDIKVNRKIVSGDTLSHGWTVTLKIPICIYDKEHHIYYDFKDGEVYALKVWVQPVDSDGNAVGEGHWVEVDYNQGDTEISFDVFTPNSHMAFFGIVDKPISGSSN